MSGHGPLDGLRVLDFSRLIPGPYCTLLLAQLGAEVVKIEDPRGGDLLRAMPPQVNGCNPLFALLNRGKQSVALDLKTPEARATAHRLAERSDVVVEGFRPGVAARLGIDFNTLAAANPRLVYCSISGFGQTGPLRDLPGHDLTFAAFSGLLDALSPGMPQVPGVQLADSAASMVAAIRILAALHARDNGPQFLDVSLTGATQALMPLSIAEAEWDGPGPTTLDMVQGSPRTNVYCCADGLWLAIAPLEQSFWERLCAVLWEDGMVPAGDVPDDASMGAAFATRPRDAWLARLSAADVPCGPVQTVRQGIEMHLAGSFPDLTPEEGSLGVPALGEHTQKWLNF